MQRLVDTVRSLSGVAAYPLVAGLAFVEAAAVVGLVVPGEVTVLLGGVLAAEGRVDLAPMMAVASVAADYAGSWTSQKNCPSAVVPGGYR